MLGLTKLIVTKAQFHFYFRGRSPSSAFLKEGSSQVLVGSSSLVEPLDRPSSHQEQQQQPNELPLQAPTVIFVQEKQESNH